MRKSISIKKYSLNENSKLFIFKKPIDIDSYSNDYSLIEVRKDVKGDYLLFLSSMGSKLNNELESKVFPSGRSRSVYENLFKIYSVLGFNNDFGDVYRYSTLRDLDYHLLKFCGFTLYGLDNVGDVKPLGYKFLSDMLIKNKNVEFVYGDNYVKSKGITRYTVEFMREISKVYLVKDCHLVRWSRDDRDECIVTLYFREFNLVLRGLEAGYGGEGPRGLYDVLKLCEFDRYCDINMVFYNKVGTITKK